MALSKGRVFIQAQVVKSWGLFIVTLLFLSGAQASELFSSLNMSNIKKTKKLSFKLTTESSFRSQEEGVESLNLVQLSTSPEVKYTLAPWLWVDTKARLNLNSATVQSRFQDNSLNTISLDRMEVVFNPIENFMFKGGAIDQSFLGSDLLIETRAFPGVVLAIPVKGEDFNINFLGQYVLPTSVSLESDRREGEEDATFTTFGLVGQANLFERFNFSLSVNAFEFKGLPGISAFESQRFGNRTNFAVSSSEAEFLYPFKGYSQVYNLGFRATKNINLSLGLHIIDNIEAPVEMRRSQLVEFGFDYKYGDVVTISPKIATYYSEPNSGPAVYNSALYGHNNRQGMEYSLRLNFSKYDFYIDLAHVNANLLNPHEVQEDMSAYFLSLGIVNEIF